MITLITTTRNRPDYLLNCAQSIYNQSTQPDEWIIYLDDSYSNYKSVLNQIASQASTRIIIVNRGQIGRVSALHYSHQLVNPLSWVGWVDDDDWLHPDCLTHCLPYLPHHDFIYTDFYEVRGTNYTIGSLNQTPYSYETLLTKNIVFHFRLFKQQLYLDCGGLDLSFDTTMDYELSLRMLKLTSPFKLNLPLYYYRIHRNRISALLSSRQRQNFLRAVKLNS